MPRRVVLRLCDCLLDRRVLVSYLRHILFVGLFNPLCCLFSNCLLGFPFDNLPFRPGRDLLNVGDLGHVHIYCPLFFVRFDWALITVVTLLPAIVTIYFVVVT